MQGILDVIFHFLEGFAYYPYKKVKGGLGRAIE